MFKVLIFALAAAANQVFATDNECNFDVSKLTPVGAAGSSKYFVNTFFKASWYGAYGFCRYNGMQLVSFQTEADLTALAALLGKTGVQTSAFWTSGNDLAASRQFIWWGNGRSFSGNIWNPGEPNNTGGAEDCVELKTGSNGVMKLNDAGCAVQNYIICEYVNDM